MIKKIFGTVFIIIISLCMAKAARADYVLPYPSFMPGNSFYKLSRIADRLNKYWYWGSIARFRHHLHLSDKYLVESKTLFEYKQFVLAIDALKRSNNEFLAISQYLLIAQKEGKDMKNSKDVLREASKSHKEVLKKIEIGTPSVFTWTPEKSVSSELFIHNEIKEAIAIRDGE